MAVEMAADTTTAASGSFSCSAAAADGATAAAVSAAKRGSPAEAFLLWGMNVLQELFFFNRGGDLPPPLFYPYLCSFQGSDQLPS